jgi:flavin-dependent dehydrogenase
MDVHFPNGRVMTLPSEPGLDEGGQGVAMDRLHFDATLHTWARRQGATEITGRLTRIDERPEGGIRLDIERASRQRRITAQVLVGADGANSTVGRSLGLIRESATLRAFAIRQYVEGSIDRPAISLIERDGRLFPGYGWVFPVADGILNVGIGISAPHRSRQASGATEALRPYQDHLLRNGLMQGSGRPVAPSLGGWLTMGMAGVTPGKRRVLLVGDAAGLINPLQGEGIAQAIESAIGAANAIREAIDDPLARYAQYLNETHGTYQRGAGALQRFVLDQPELASSMLRLISTPALARRLAPTWGIYWNDLAQTTGPIRGAGLARSVERVAAFLTTTGILPS